LGAIWWLALTGLTRPGEPAIDQRSAPRGGATRTVRPRAPSKRSIGSRLSVRNVVPAHFLRARFGAAHATVLFSATLAPWEFYVDCLGLPADSTCVDIPPAFRSEQLRVRIARGVSTRFHDRDRSAVPIAELVAAELEREPGNYLVYLSSHAYLAQVADAFALRHPQIASWRQHPAMAESEREAFLQRFADGGRGVGFAVLGGAFGEAIDLAGSRLIGVFVATLGLPQWNPVNEQMRQRLDRLYGQGYAYTYLYPGLRKVVQAAGRVLRSETDRGSVHLIDERYARAEVRRLLPQWWRIETLASGRHAP
jgi:DNA excision repair protein ERCC-2